MPKKMRKRLEQREPSRSSPPAARSTYRRLSNIVFRVSSNFKDPLPTPGAAPLPGLHGSRARQAPRKPLKPPPRAPAARPGTSPDRRASPYSSAASKWVRAAAPANPMAMPVSAIRRPLPTTIRSTSAERAPSAMRMPNSRVRRLTENASTPKIPTAASASAPNVPTSCARKRGWAMDWAATSSMVRTRVTACSFVHARDGGLHRGRHRQRISRGTHRDRCGEPRILCNRHVDLQLILLGGPRDFDLMNYAHHLAHHGLRSAHIHGLYSYVRPNLLHARLHALQIPPHQFFVDDAHRRGRGIVVFREGAAVYQPDPQRLEILRIDHLIVRRGFLGLAYRRRAHHGESLADFPAIHRQAEPQPHLAHARQAGHFTLGGLVECERALGRFVPRQRERDVHRQDAIRVVAR